MSNSRAKILLAAVLVTVLLALAPFAWHQYEWRRRFQHRNQVQATIESFRTRRPPNVPEDQWTQAIKWTSNVISQDFYYPHGDELKSLQQLSRLLDQKSTGHVDLGTLRWVWDECEKANGGPRSYAIRFRDVGLLTTPPITDESLPDLWSRAKVSWLDLGRTQITDAGLKHLSDLTQLRSLSLYETAVTDSGLASLMKLPQLTSLRLDGTSVSDAGLQDVKALKQLKLLTLGETNVSNGGLKELRDMTQLEELHLYGTSVTSAGLEHLNGLTSLIHLDLRNTAVDDSGIEHIRSLKTLRTLALKGTAVTPNGIADLQLALPRCEFTK